jgi:hypothetical protein
MRIAAATLAATLATLSLVGCGTELGPDPGLEALEVTQLAPRTIIPGTRLVVKGASFVDEQWGAATLRLRGQAGGRDLDVRWPATFVDFGTMTVAVEPGAIAALGGDVDFAGEATVEIVATSDGNTYVSPAIEVSLAFRETLTPAPSSVQNSGVIFVNDRIQVDGDGFLLGGDEGTTFARIAGCFTLEGGGGCVPIAEQEIPLSPTDPLERTQATFPFAPSVAGIRPGTFTGTVTITNQQPGKAPIAAAEVAATYDLVSPQVFTVCTGDPCSTDVQASLGQYVFVQGGGFVGGEADALTELELSGTFQRTGAGSAPVSMTLIPEFVEGRLVRYVVNTDDELGQALDLRQDTGRFTGTITPIISYRSDRVRGASKQVTLSIAPVKQVVYLDFLPSYVEGVNIEFRTTPPTDFALYMHVELSGVDPNNLGLFGYDNTPGKDNGNLRLYDRLGGVNAATQQDGYPGYGGVFLRSLMGFSLHPGSFARTVAGADPMFDRIFDPFRADLDGRPVRSTDLVESIPALTNGASCPASDRAGQIACAIFVLGNLVGGTLAHEIGHSLGLANPYAEGFHNPGDAPNRIMDSGGDRPFLERAELEGQGPGVFCDTEYEYLRQILPTSAPAPAIQRPRCF